MFAEVLEPSLPSTSQILATVAPVKLRSGTPYWLACDQGLPGEAVYQPLLGDARCEVMVLGGGITGALVAYQLVQFGIDVLLIDRLDFGHGGGEHRPVAV